MERTIEITNGRSGVKENSKNRSSALMVAFAAAYLLAVKVVTKLIPGRGASVMFISISYIVLGTAGLYIFREDFKKGLEAWREHTLKSALWLIGGFLANSLLMSLAYLPSMMLYPDYEGINDNNIYVAMQLMPAPLFVLAAGVMGPLAEEAFFRFILVDKAKRRLPVMLCVTVSSVLFMFWHVHALIPQDILINLPKLVTSVIFCVTMQCSGNKTIPSVIHVFGNTSALIMMLMSSAYN